MTVPTGVPAMNTPPRAGNKDRLDTGSVSGIPPRRRKDRSAKYRSKTDTAIPAELRVLAEQDDRSLSQYINLILKEYLKSGQDN